jgi:DNA polymerase I
MKKLFLLDALALIYRSYYALIRNPRLTSDGRNTNAQFGFTTTLVDLINKERPTHMAVCFDTHAPTERHTDFEDYKANREDAPEDLLAALPDIKRVIEGFNIPVVELDGYEADDIIGTVALQAADAGYTVYMVTPDKDYGQIVRDNIYIYKPSYQGNAPEIMGPKEVCEKWGINNVHQVIDILGLMGDAVDNIPGIRGVGEKTAVKLLTEYHTLENVLANADSIKGALGEKVRAGKEDAILSKKLATIITNVPVEFHEENYRLKELHKEKLTEIFTELEFKALGKRILGDAYNVHSADQKTDNRQRDLFGDVVNGGATEKISKAVETLEDEEEENNGNNLPSGISAGNNITNTPHEYILVDTDKEIDHLIQTLKPIKEICFDTETTGKDANDVELVGMSFAVEKGKGWYVPFPVDQKVTQERVNKFLPLFNDATITWVGHNIKYDLLVMKWYGVEFTGVTIDTMLAHYLVDPEGRRSMDLLSTQYLGYEPVSIETLIGKKGKNQGSMRDADIELVKEYAVEDADVTLQLSKVFKPMILERAVDKVFYEVENPLVPVLAAVEFEGVKVDMDFLKEYSKLLEKDAAESEKKVYLKAGVTFNLASPRQLGEVLFDKLKLDPKAKKTKTGQYATGEDVLQKLASQHDIVEDILTFRELTKLKSTYVDALPELINRKTGRVHTSFNQAIAVTGRLSSNNPNLQNIPVRTERGREIRKAFIPRNSEYILISADYSQIELRIVAAMSGDENMCAAFKAHKDIHAATAARVYGVEEIDVTKEMRYKAKSVNFGIIYGQGAFGLAENLRIPRSEAKELIENYWKQYGSIRTFLDKQVNFARENGYAETLMGRKRWLRDIMSANAVVRGFAERNAVNMPIQGTAADMIKLAMIRIHKEIKSRNLKSKMILQVHDELVFDVHRSEVEIIKPLILDGMQHALKLPNDVPTDAEIGVGENWLEAH